MIMGLDYFSNSKSNKYEKTMGQELVFTFAFYCGPPCFAELAWKWDYDCCIIIN